MVSSHAMLAAEITPLCKGFAVFQLTDPGRLDAADYYTT